MKRQYRIVYGLGAALLFLLFLCVVSQLRTRALENHLYTDSSHTFVEQLSLPASKHGDIGIVSAFYDREARTYQIRLSKRGSDLSALDIPQIYLMVDGDGQQAHKVNTVFYEDLHRRTDAILLFSDIAFENRITIHLGSTQYDIVAEK